MYPWLEYSVERDAVFCFPCRFFRFGADKALTCTGFRDWGASMVPFVIMIKNKEAMLSWKEHGLVAQGASIQAQLDKEDHPG